MPTHMGRISWSTTITPLHTWAAALAAQSSSRTAAGNRVIHKGQAHMVPLSLQCLTTPTAPAQNQS
jgi:hypothetical protein